MKKLRFYSFAVQKLLITACWFFAVGYSFADSPAPESHEPLKENAVSYTLDMLPAATHFLIDHVDYDIKGLTQKKILEIKVPIDTKTIFTSKDEFTKYMSELKNQFTNIRTLEKTEFTIVCSQPDSENLSRVALTVHTEDTFNFLAVPYPKYDSNTGVSIKLKLKDNNFFGTMQPFDSDINFVAGEDRAISTKFSFVYPYRIKEVLANQAVNAALKVALGEEKKADFNFSTKSAFSYTYRFLTVGVGLEQGFTVKKDTDMIGEKIGSKGYKYKLNTTPDLWMSFLLASLPHFGSLVYAPSVSFGKSWAFSKEVNQNLRGCDINVNHSLSLGAVHWKNNFREGLTFSLSNGYKYNTFKKDVPQISVAANFKGYIPFFDRFGFSVQANFFYNFNSDTTNTAGTYLRGILDKRIDTDMAVTFNLDMPIKVLDIDFGEATGKPFMKIFSFEMQLAPFLDFALVHDIKTGRYFSPQDAWCSGGIEVILFPKKFRSVYVRASVGFDLRELKNSKGIMKVKDTAKRDGLPVGEVFVGIGLHY